MTQQQQQPYLQPHPGGEVWFGTWHGCSGTYLGESYIQVPKRCPQHGGPLMAEPDFVTGLADRVTFGTVHLDYTMDEA
jgi:hypothetical protein